MQNNYDVLIIGGGVAGLMAGIELSKNDKKVVILEKESVVGGQCLTEILETKDEKYRTTAVALLNFLTDCNYDKKNNYFDFVFTHVPIFSF